MFGNEMSNFFTLNSKLYIYNISLPNVFLTGFDMKLSIFFMRLVRRIPILARMTAVKGIPNRA